MSETRRVPVYCVDQMSNHPPLALGMITAFARTYKDGALNGWYDFVPGYLTAGGAVQETVWQHGPGILLCSNYIWNLQHNLLISRLVKSFFPASITIHGGPSAPKYDYNCEEYFRDHPHVDIVARGEGEETAAVLLEQLALHAADYAAGNTGFLATVPGITFRGPDGALVRTPDRPIERDLDRFPSPYLTGAFSDQDAKGWRAAIIETNRGCPYGCTYCDWGSATLSKIRRFSMERVAGEIEWMARNGMEVLWIADANFGIFDRDVEIAEFIADCRRKYGFPREVVVNYAKNATQRLARIVAILHECGISANGIISIQTRDPGTLAIIQRSNIATERYEDLIDIFNRHRLPVSSDLMIGLPGSTLETFRDDLQFFFDRGVKVKCYRTTLLPNSQMAHRDYREKYRIELNAEGEIDATSSFTRDDIRKMIRLQHLYDVAVRASSLKYVLIHLQLDHGIGALKILNTLRQAIHSADSRLPETARLVKAYPESFGTQDSGGWSAVYAEIRGFIARRFGIETAAFDTVLRVQQAVMPANDRNPPEMLALAHDFAGWFAQFKGARNLAMLGAVTPLADFGPATLAIGDPRDLCGANRNSLTAGYDNHCVEWELASPMTEPEAEPLTASVAIAG
ncbi:MAG: radical SAM protein [Sphingomonas sp.]